MAPMAPMAALADAAVLVVAQDAKMTDLTAEYTVRDGNGTDLLRVTQVQSPGQGVARFFLGSGRQLNRAFEIRAIGGTAGALMTLPSAKARKQGQPASLTNADGGVIGMAEYSSEKREGEKGRFPTFALALEGAPWATMAAKDWRGRGYSVVDAGGVPLAETARSWPGVASALFTHADAFAIGVSGTVGVPGRLLLIGTVVCADAITTDP